VSTWSSLVPDADGHRPAPPGPPVLVEVVRDGFVESRHRGDLVALNADGGIAFAVGEPEMLLLPRSANKPLQAAALLRCGLDLSGELLALAAASHSGEPFHLEGVQRILAAAGLTVDALACPPDWPFDELERLAYARRGLEPAPVAMNCSGKHAAMLATCVANGWPVTGYLDPTHPVQVAVREEVERLSGEVVAHIGVDGCGAPLFGITLHGLALCYRRLALSEPGSPEHAVVAAIQAFPEWTSGTTRDEAELLRALPGLVAKVGAEAVYAAAFSDGRAVALKIEDGGQRARPVAMAAALRRLGVEHRVLDAHEHPPVRGGGLPVGELRAAFG